MSEVAVTSPERALAVRGAIQDLEAACMALPAEQRFHEIPLTHHFIDGAYIRSCRMTKGDLIVGKIHRLPHLVIVLCGRARVLSEDMDAFVLEGPTVLNSSAGAKRTFEIEEDMVLTTVHPNPTNTQDLSLIENYLIAEDYDDLYLRSERTFKDVLLALRKTEEDCTRVSENLLDQTFVDDDAIEVKPSLIHGKGIFATRDICAGELVAPALIKSMRTRAGRYSNHSGTPNAKMEAVGDDANLIALQDISAGEEVTSDYYFNYQCARGIK